MKIVGKIFLYGVSVLLFLLLLAVGLGWFYAPEIRQKVEAHFNQYLNTEVRYGSMDVSLLRNFPYASVVIEDVKIRETLPGSAENMAEAGSFELLFNIWEIFGDELVVEKVRLVDAVVNLRVDAQNNVNYDILKDQEKSSQTQTDFRLNVNRIELVNVNFLYDDKYRGQSVAFLVENGRAAGAFSSSNYSLNLDAELQFHHYVINSTAYIKNKKTVLKGELDVQENTRYIIKKADISLGGAAFTVAGSFTDGEDAFALDLDINGKETGIQTLLALVPDEYNHYIKDYKSRGNVWFSAGIKGKITEHENPLFTVSFGIENGEVTNTQQNITMEQVNLKGNFTNGKKKNLTSSMLELKGFSGILRGQKLQGDFLIENFDDPYIAAKAITDVNLRDLHGFFRFNGVKEMHGRLAINASLAGKISDFKKYSTLRNTSMSGTASLDSITVIPDSSHLVYRDLNGKFVFRNNDLEVQNFSAKVSESDFTLNGSFKNFTSFLFVPGQDLVIRATFNSKLVNLNELLKAESTGGGDTVYSLSLPEYFDFEFNLNAERVVWDKFDARNMRGRIKYKDKRITLENVSCNAMQGNLVLNGAVEERNNRFYVKGNTRINNINMRELFYQVENFGQDFFTHKHINGKVNATVDFGAIWNSNLGVDLNSINAVADMTVTDGEIVNFEPLYKMSTFVKLKKLQHIKFETLSNRIFIEKQVITIPAMDVYSSAMSMNISGEHNFDNIYKYNIKLNLSDLLARENPYESEFGEVERTPNGGINLFLIMEGNGDDVKFRYDRGAVKKKLAQDMKEEKKELKEIFTKTPDTGEDIYIDPKGSGGSDTKQSSGKNTEKDRKKAYKSFWEKLKEE